MATFTKLTRAEWVKYGEKRFNILREAIENKTKVQDFNGKDYVLEKSQANLTAVDLYESDKTLKSVDLKLDRQNKTIPITNLGKSPLFGGSGAGGGATAETQRGECLQCLYLEAMLSEGKIREPEYYTAAVLKKYYSSKLDASFDFIMKAQPAWFASGYVTAKYLIEKKLVNKNLSFHRGDTIMKTVYRYRKEAFKNSGMPALTEDKWNPGDIWAVDKKIGNLNRVLDNSSIETLNEDIKQNLLNKKVFGISLKQIDKISKSAKHEIINLEEAVLESHTFTGAIVKKKDRGTPTYWSGKGGQFEYDNANLADLRASSPMATVNVELLLKGARGGKGGYGQVQYAHKTYLGLDLPDNAIMKNIAKEIKDKTVKMVNELFMMANKVDPTVTREEYDEGLADAEIDRIHANYVATKILYDLVTAPKEKADKWVTYMVNYAGSKLTTSSAYIKVSAA